MSKEAASKFVQAVLNAKELREKTANIKPEELIPFAKEEGYDFTLEELQEVKKEDIELLPDELEGAAGGFVRGKKTIREQNLHLHCYNDLKKPLHQWVKIGHKEEPFLGGLFEGGLFGWSTGYDVYECTLCHICKDEKV